VKVEEILFFIFRMNSFMWVGVELMQVVFQGVQILLFLLG